MTATHNPEIVSVERIDGTDVLVEFSDGTIASFSAEQLAALAPDRKPANGNFNDLKQT